MEEEPIVEMVEEECPIRLVFDNAKELFPSKMVYVKEAYNINCLTDAPPDSAKTVFYIPLAQSTKKLAHHNHNKNLINPGEVAEIFSLDFLQGKD